MRKVLASSLFAVGLLFSASGMAETVSPVGTWTQIPDTANGPRSIVQITRQPDGTLQGVVTRVLASRQGTHPLCDKCTGARHNQPVVGMQVIWGVKRDGDTWDGGHILDPVTGKIYKVKLTLADGGTKLKVRGYVGMPMLGRTETWLRRTPPAATGSTAASDQRP